MSIYTNPLLPKAGKVLFCRTTRLEDRLEELRVLKNFKSEYDVEKIDKEILKIEEILRLKESDDYQDGVNNYATLIMASYAAGRVLGIIIRKLRD